jgi:adenine-specific DNA-methyltransferase
MGRQYIGIEQLDYGENCAIVRLKNVINGGQSGIQNQLTGKAAVILSIWNLQWNENFVEKITKSKNQGRT